MRKLLPLIALLLGVGAGCGTDVTFIPAQAPKRVARPRPADQVEVLTHGPPARRFVELGVLEAVQASYVSLHDRHQVFDAMRARAGEIGCDAIVVASDDGLPTDVNMNQPRRYPFGDHAAWRAVCIVYTGT